MTLRPLLLAAAVGIAAAVGVFHSPAAKAEGSFSISIGSHSPYYDARYGVRHDPRYGVRHDPRYHQRYVRGGGYYNDYGRNHRPGYTFVPGHWAYGQRGRVWVPAQYVRVHGHYGYRPNQRVILRPLPGGFYEQRGGYDYYPPRGW